MILWLVLGIDWLGFRDGQYRAVGSGFLLWVLLGLLGYGEFGSPIK